MDATDAARLEAEKIHLAAVADGSCPWRPLEFAIKEADRRQLDVYALPKGDPALKGGQAVFDSQAGAILYQDVGTTFDRAFLVAHELGHLVLEGGQDDVVTVDAQPGRSIEDAPVGAESLMDYGARERREIKMDLFAREFLLPRSVARALHVEDGCSSSEIAQRTGAPLPVVQQQLLDALLLPSHSAGGQDSITEQAVLRPDPSQQVAASHRNTPFQLQAGPGTGKTRTLVQRIESLIRDGEDPTSILVLTFSNKAANELSERIAATNPLAAAAMWIGSFHAFGLDIIRRFHQKLELPPDPRLIDRVEGIELLEAEVPRLSLHHYRNLWDPTLDLNDILNAISRAKDETIDSAGYRALAESMVRNASGDTDASLRAEKCLEVALVYETYERLMRDGQLVDFGDLVSHPVRLAEADSEVRDALRTRHKHVLVDEYQDVNRSSIRLLKAIVGGGENLWVVGDARQSIYRFRGASASNMAQFGTDFPGAVAEQLGVNYRSRQEIVDAFSTFSTTMKASMGALPLALTANRGNAESKPEYRVVGSAEDEIAAVAASIRVQRESGTAYREQALLCASNTRLSEIAEGLEARGIPVLHLGSIFERPEIKTLLAMLSILNDASAVGLIRVSAMAGYEMPIPETVNLIRHLRASKAAPLGWLSEESWPSLHSEDSKVKLSSIAQLFEGLNPRGNPWNILASWVIDRLGLAKNLHLAGDARSKMRGLALWQFLNFCRKQPSGSELPCIRLLDRIRRLVLISGDRGLRHLPKAAGGIDAVRLMTIHGSKGLEFPTVHLPGMVAASLPRNNRPPRCVPPDGLIYGSVGLSGLEAVKAGHEEEEECLFFVALSRSRDRLFLYASSFQADGKKRSQSKFIDPIRQHLTQPANPPLLAADVHPKPSLDIVWEQKPIWDDSQVAQFERCPRRFLYSHVLGLGGRRTETAFLKMHNAVRTVSDWLKTDCEHISPSQIQLDAAFDAAWLAEGAVDHGYAEDYRIIARRLVDYLVKSRSEGTPIQAVPISIDGVHGDIVVRPDSVVRSDSGQIIVRRVKTGKPKSNGFDDIEYTLLHMAAVQNYGSSAKVEVTYLTSETTDRMSITDRKLTTRRENSTRMLSEIRSGAFAPRREARVCPSCPNFFVCGDLPTGTVVGKKN